MDAIGVVALLSLFGGVVGLKAKSAEEGRTRTGSSSFVHSACH